MKDFLSLLQKRKSKKHLQTKGTKKHLYLLSPVPLLVPFLIGLLIGIVLWDRFLHEQISQDRIPPRPFAAFKPSLYPLLTITNMPPISAEGVMIMDADSHRILYAKDPDVRFSPASTTKIMTALVGLDQYDVSDPITIHTAMDTQGSGLNLIPGEQMKFGDLLYGALVYSANDAAVAIATAYPTGLDGFIKHMNDKARQLHLFDTHYADPAGLNDDYDYTTPRNLVQLAAVAMQDPVFRRIVSTQKITIASTNQEYAYTIDNRNTLLGLYGVTGIKTGYTDQAGEVLATSAMKNGHTIYIIVMKSNDRFGDTTTLLQFIWENLSYQDIDPVLH